MDCEKEAKQVVKAVLKATGINYCHCTDSIASLFAESLYNGNWDDTLEFPENNRRALRFIQEDEFDKLHDEDDMPNWDDQLTLAAGHYIFFGD